MISKVGFRTQMADNHTRFVAHLDILGMSSIVARDPEEGWKLLTDLVASLEDVSRYEFQFTELGQSVLVAEHIKSVTFSDTIVLFTRGATDMDLRCLLIAAVALFHRALVRCVPIRVGIAYGTFFFNLAKSMYAGPALISAYRVGESAQWIGLSLCDSVRARAESLGLKSGHNEIVVPWNVPTKQGYQSCAVLNWPAAVRNDLKVEPPQTVEQFYQIFEPRFGSFTALPDDAKRKYENCIEFFNTMLCKVGNHHD